MKKKIGIGILSLGAGVFLSSKALAQGTLAIDQIQSNPSFLMAVIAGVLIALGFQMVLTNLSLAVGITSIGNIKDKALRESGEEKSEPSKKMASMPLGVMLSSGIGIWK